MDSDSDNQSDSTEQMDESDDLDDLRVSPYPESADIIIRNINRKSSPPHSQLKNAFKLSPTTLFNF